MPLIIKVASYLKKGYKYTLLIMMNISKGKQHFGRRLCILIMMSAIFFAKGVVETVKKLNWVPDIIHVHGWMAAMLPIYMKHYYKMKLLFRY
jgi:starch synthase